ncbi:hypothetical protein FH972_024307 [Carpinus fangiana]|uniref:Uncharacterized protein n=1 Tax=Carpinus fangiana TaxID=176857 RepID=A0A5N6KYK1_9ROSI|nr:hypothetical protein FH972_024307 [Carpinus fangiana]
MLVHACLACVSTCIPRCRLADSRSCRLHISSMPRCRVGCESERQRCSFVGPDDEGDDGNALKGCRRRRRTRLVSRRQRQDVFEATARCTQSTWSEHVPGAAGETASAP